MKNIIWADKYRNSAVKAMSELQGEIVSKVCKVGEDEFYIQTKSGKVLKVYHEQDCCEAVYIEDEDIDDVVGGYIHFVGFVEGDEPQREMWDSYTWSFFKMDTSKGSVWLRWLGESNGYYSESVDVNVGVIEGSEVYLTPDKWCEEYMEVSVW